MKPVAFNYSEPASLQAACKALAGPGDGANVMGGSQSMGPMLNMRLIRPSSVVDISRLHELRGVAAAGDRIRIGAAVTHSEIEDGVYPELRGTFLQSVARGIAYRAVRNRGTLGGSLAHADPAADWVVVCTALDAQLELVSASGARRVSMDKFMLGAYTTSLQHGEIIAAINVPRETASTRWAYEKSCRKTGEFSEASCAAWFDPAQHVGRIVLGALDGSPRVLNELTLSFASMGAGALNSAEFRAQLLAAVADAMPERDEVDRTLMRTVARRCLEQLLEDPAR